MAGLGASEAAIYGRFGYGPATWDSSWRLARGAARGLAGRDDHGRLELVDAPAAGELFPAVHEQARRSQVGDVRAFHGRWHDLIGDDPQPLRWALADSRQLEVTGVDDHLWVRLIDLPAALSGRRYAAEGSVILDVADPFCPWNQGRWLLEGGPDGATCRPAGRSAGASLRLDAGALGSLFLGGTSVAHLARAGRAEADAASVSRAEEMFRADFGPWCSTDF